MLVSTVRDVIEALIEEAVAEAVAGVREQRIHFASSKPLYQLLDTATRGEIALDQLHPAASALQFRNAAFHRSIGRDHHIANPLARQQRASSSPMPLDPPVTTASLRIVLPMLSLHRLMSKSGTKRSTAHSPF